MICLSDYEILLKIDKIQDMLPKIDTIIFISNPFGFGPAGKAIILMEELRKKWHGKIIYIASQKCLDILPEVLKNAIEVIEINERDPQELKKTLSRLTSAMVVVVLNKSAIKTAHDLDMKTFFIDSLSWMWKEIPKEYLSADTYYYYNIFGSQKRLSDMRNARPISPILGALPERKKVYSRFLLHIGGFSNPFIEDNVEYLKLLNELLNHIDHAYEVTVVGGRSGINFLREINNKSNIEFLVLGRESFLEKIAQAERFITTPGSTAVFEAFSIGTPTSFLPPTNLSQWKQLKLFFSLSAAPLEMQWERYLQTPEGLENMSENNALKEFSRLPEFVLKNQNIVGKMGKDFEELFSQEANFTGQRDLIKSTGDGSSEIISDILKVVNSSGI